MDGPALARFCPPRNQVTYSFQHHTDQDPQQLITFWAAHLGIEPSLIRYQRKSNSGQLKGRTWRSKYGVPTVRADDTLFRVRLQGWMNCIVKQWL